jgi:hypothetical protein
MKNESQYLKLQLEKLPSHRQTFIKESAHDDMMIVLIRADLYIEKELHVLMDIFLPHLREADKHFSYQDKVNFLFGLGVIDEELYQPVISIHQVRNKLSKGSSFTEEIYEKLYQSLTGNILGEFQKDLEVVNELAVDIDFSHKTRILAAGIWTSLKAVVLTSYIKKKEIAVTYQKEAEQEIMNFFSR